MNIVLIGFMCSGKTRVGRVLAQQLSWRHIDSDELIVKDAGMSIADMIQTKGEEKFRELEKKIIKDVSERDQCVISTGGGVPMNSDNMKHLQKKGELVWLRIRPETVLSRVGDVRTRPMIDPSNPLESITTRLREREKFYSVAPAVIDVDNLDPSKIAQKIISIVPGLHVS